MAGSGAQTAHASLPRSIACDAFRSSRQESRCDALAARIACWTPRECMLL